ncbi:MAG: hypothetical protein IIB94_08750 [Candidatus Marinimicrobia bacterium]|nr:hypothetical protein [Candidatus Neomarinimicrobiota bacterium]
MKLLVGNLSSEITPGLVQSIFETYGSVTSISITKEKFTNEYIAQIEMPNAHEAANAIEHVDSKEIGGRSVIIKNREELINEISTVTNNENSEHVEDNSSTNADIDIAIDIHESARMTSENRRNLKSERRTIKSPLFSKERGLVIDRRNEIDRRDSLKKI